MIKGECPFSVSLSFCFVSRSTRGTARQVVLASVPLCLCGSSPLGRKKWPERRRGCISAVVGKCRAVREYRGEGTVDREAAPVVERAAARAHPAAPERVRRDRGDTVPTNQNAAPAECAESNLGPQRRRVSSAAARKASTPAAAAGSGTGVSRYAWVSPPVVNVRTRIWPASLKPAMPSDEGGASGTWPMSVYWPSLYTKKWRERSGAVKAPTTSPLL